jgi:hypothetical protein
MPMLLAIIDTSATSGATIYVSICLASISALAIILAFSSQIGRERERISRLREDLERYHAEHNKEIEFLHTEHHQYLHTVVTLASDFSRDLGKVEGQLIRINGKPHGG